MPGSRHGEEANKALGILSLSKFMLRLKGCHQGPSVAVQLDLEFVRVWSCLKANPEPNGA